MVSQRLGGLYIPATRILFLCIVIIRTYDKTYRTDKYSQFNSIIRSAWANDWVFVYELSGCGFESCCSHVKFRYYGCFELEVPWHSANIVCGFTVKRVCETIRTYSQMHRTDKYPQLSSIIWSLWPNGCVFIYEVSGSGFESCWSHLNFRYCACFRKRVPKHSGKHRVWIHPETRT